MKNLRAAYGQYAVVTGESSGIGEQFARRARVIPGATNNAADLLIKHMIRRSLSVNMFGWLFGRALFETVPHGQ